MKIVCDTCVVNRTKPQVKNRSVKSTLAVGKSNKENSKVFLILINGPQNKAGSRYDLTNNISKIFTKFLNEGKCTISLKLPEIDIQVKADPIQMKTFLNVMKNELCPDKGQSVTLKDSSGNRLLKAFSSTLASATSTTKNIHTTIQTKLVITSRGDYPAKGFPRTLNTLLINGIGRCQLDRQILNLVNLTLLNLSDNSIEKLPKELGNLKLSEVNLSSNKFGLSTKKSDWEWLCGQNMKRSLIQLHLSKNQMNFVPPQLAECENLVILKLDNNSIRKLPFCLKQLKKLQFLYLQNNQISSVPFFLKQLRLDTLDISDNLEGSLIAIQKTHDTFNQLNFQHNPLTLMELSAQSTVYHKIPYNFKNIPQILKQTLTNSATCSFCNKINLNSEIYSNICIITLCCKNVTFSGFSNSLHADGTFCNKKCIQLFQRRNFGTIMLR